MTTYEIKPSTGSSIIGIIGWDMSTGKDYSVVTMEFADIRGNTIKIEGKVVPVYRDDGSILYFSFVPNRK